MKTKKRLATALVFSLFAAVSAPTQAAQFSNVYVFGDSLSDAGYFRPFLTSLGLPASLVATLGRFTINPGPVWSELVAAHYGVTNPRPSNAGGTIFAQGGARVTASSSSTPPGSAQRPVSTQIDEFLAANSGRADPGALYAVWGGANDLLQNFAAFSAGQITQAQLQTNILAAAAADVQQVARLQAAGARYILVFGMPDVGATPALAAGGAAAAGAATQLSAGYNTTLFTGLQSAGIRAIPVDTFGLFTDVRTNASQFGFTNTTGVACLPFPPITTTSSSQFCTAQNIAAGGASFLFADGVHPTPEGHRILGDYVQSLIDVPSQYSLMAETALRARAQHVRTIASGGQAALGGDIGKLSAFAAADGGDLDFEAAQGLQAQRTRNRALTVGLVTRVSENVGVGVAVGTTRAKAASEGVGPSYRLDERTFSLFASARGRQLYAAAAVSIGNTDYNDIQRNLRLGNAARQFQANAQGSNASTFASMGYDFNIGRLRIGPTLAVAAQNVEVEQFEETPLNASPATLTGALTIAKQKRRSEIWSGGVRASYDLGAWTPWVRLTADRERRDDEREVGALVRSLGAIGNFYTVPGYRIDSSSVTTYAGINGRLSDWVGLGLTYYKVSGRSGIKEDGIVGAVSVRF